MYKVAVLGDRDSIYGFSALGFDIVPVFDKVSAEKELKRFKQEFEIMKSLNSPYIVDVYSYNDDNNSYIMEYMDFTLDKKL